jgi:hypothetical protein
MPRDEIDCVPGALGPAYLASDSFGALLSLVIADSDTLCPLQSRREPRN